MNKIQLLLSSVGLVSLVSGAYFIRPNAVSNPAFLEWRNEEAKHESQEIAGALKYYQAITANQTTHTIDQKDVVAAR